MNRPSWKRLVSSVLALLLISVIIVFSVKPNAAEAAWFDDNWAYRKTLTFTHNATVSTPSQVEFDIDTTEAPEKFQADCGDVRFTDPAGNVLSYWYDSASGACDTASTDFDVLMPSIINGSNYIYMYYGNPSAPNGTRVTDFSEATTTPSGGAASAGSEEKVPGPVLYWTFDDGTGTTAQDSSSNNKDGTLTMGPLWQREELCIVNKCLSFDGSDDYVSISSPNLPTGDFTYSAWIYPVDNTSTYVFHSSDGSGGNEFALFIDGSSQLAVTLDAGSPDATSSQTLAANKWYRVSVTRSGGNITLYINGVASGTGTDSATLNFSSCGLLIGVDVDTSGCAGVLNEYFTGRIDEPKVYSYARSADQIKTDFTARGSSNGSSVLGVSDQAYLSDGLVGYWKEDEASDASATDASGNSNTLTDTNTVARTAGKFGNGADFESGNSEYQYIADNATLSLTGSLTLASWIKPESVTAATLFDIVGKWSGANESYLLAQYGDEVRCYIDSSSNYVETTAANLATGIWYHVACVYDAAAGTARVYINGTQSTTTTSGTIPTSIGDDAGRLHIGAEDSTTTPANFYDGVIDGVRVYSRVLSAREVALLYAFAAGPVGYWQLDEKTGTTTADSSGNGNTGTFNSSPSPLWKIGKFGAGVSMNGSDNNYISAGAPATLEMGTGDMTFEAWAKLDSASSVANPSLIEKGGTANGTEGYWWEYSNSSGFLQFRLSDGATRLTANGATNIKDGRWHHHAVVVDRDGNATLYLDGKVDGTPTDFSSFNGTDITNNAKNFYISSGSSGSAWFGFVDEVKVYNYTRTQKQINESMNGGHPAVGSPVGSAIAHWDFDEGAANTCTGGANDVCNSGNMTSALDGAFGASTASPTISKSGKYGKALSFDGGDYVDFGANTIGNKLNGASATTVSTWFKVNNWPTGGVRAQMFKVIVNGTSAGILVDIVDSAPDIIEVAGRSSSGDSLKTGEYSFSSTNEWHHIVGVLDYPGQKIYMYLDGVLVGTHPETFGSSVYTQGTATGRDAMGATLSSGLVATETFDGVLDETKVYSYGLTADEVKREYNRGQSMQLGANGTTAAGVSDNSAERSYCPPGDATATCAPIGEWRFEEGSGTTVADLSGNGNTLNASVSTIWAVGKNGKGLYTANATKYACAGTCNHASGDGSSDSLDFTASENFSISMWFKSKTTANPGTAKWLLGKGNSSTPGYDIRGNASGRVLFQIDGGDGTYDDQAASVSGTDFFDARWHHVTAVKTGTSKIEIYVDGVLSGSDVSLAETGDLTNARAFTVGDRFGDGSNGTDVIIDQVRVYRYALSQGQIAWDYNFGAPTARWDMDECQGTTINDLSGNSYTGTLTIGASGEDTVGTCGTASTAWGSGASGKRNYSVDLDGSDDYIQVTDTAILRFDEATKDFSLFAWVKRGANGEMNVLSKEDADNDGYRLQFTSGNVVRCSVDAIDVDSTGTITDTNWHHIGCTIDRDGNGQVYIDGKANGTATAISSEVMATTSNIRIGTRSYTSTNYLDGQIDDTRIYTYPLTALQVKDLYNGGAVRFAPVTGTP